MWLLFCVFERLGGEYFRWWLNAQHMLPYGLCIVFVICDGLCPFFFKVLFSPGIETPDRNGLWYQHLLTLFAILYESNTEETNFWITFTFYVCIMCMLCIVFQIVHMLIIILCYLCKI